MIKPFKGALIILALAMSAGCTDDNTAIESDLGDVSGLSKGICPLIHCDAEQSDAFDVAGPESPSRVLDDEEVDLLWSSPIAGGVLDHVYADGQRVFWVPQVDRIMKLRLKADNRLEKIAEHFAHLELLAQQAAVQDISPLLDQLTALVAKTAERYRND